jgi:hypothetical protein
MAELNIIHNAGFFSCCSVRLHHIINFFNTHRRLPVSIDSSCLFAAYKINANNHEEDISKLLFEDQPFQNIEFVRNVDYIESYQYKPYKKLDLNNINPFIEKYFNPTKEVLDYIEFLEQKYNIDYANIASVFYRGNDKVTETVIGSYSEYFNKCQEIYNKNNNIKFLIQTDELEFRDEFKNNFSNSFFLEEMPCIKSRKYSVVHKLINRKERPEFGKKILSATKIVSKCKHLVTHSGNCGIWAVLFRGNTENVHQLLLHPNEKQKGWI